LGKRLLFIIILSFLIHAGIFYLVSPVFYSGSFEKFLYSWGQFQDTGLLPLRSKPLFLAKRANYQEFLLPSDKQISVEPEKIVRESKPIKSFPEHKIRPSFTKKAVPFFFCLDKLDFPDNLRLAAVTDKDLALRKFFTKDRIKMNLLISPTGRVICAQESDFSGDIHVRFDLEDWIRNLVFPAQKTYYWKYVEIVLK